VTKVLTIVGTRPEIIRLSRVIARLQMSVEHILVHTGQNYDYELNGIFFEEMGISPPNHFLNVNTSSLGTVLGETMIKVEDVLLKERPDAVLVLGDTNSCLASIIAKRMRIPVYHMEAGNRCFDENVPEETNRRIVDHVADFNLVYTEHARRNLLAEGLHPRRILLTGSPMKEVLSHHHQQFAESRVLELMGLTASRYLLASTHREENVDNPSRLGLLVDSLEAVQLRYRVPVLVSTHPRTRKRLAELKRQLPQGVIFHPPVGFIDYIRLQQEALCVMSDSGTISEESSILGFPAVTLRDSIERPEALDTGSIIMTGLEPANVLEAIDILLLSRSTIKPIPTEYSVENCSERVLRFIVSTHRRYESWHGLR
jgi:UDP-N-acetylglucosamine 2-epimerase